MSALEDAYYAHGRKMRENLEMRSELYALMDKDINMAAVERELCSIHDPDEPRPTGVFRFFENHLWTHEPRPHILRAYGPEFVNRPMLPFLLFDFQKVAVAKLCEAIENGHDVLIDKSRDMGVTWIVLSTMFYFWWSRDKGNEFLLGSRKWDYVDKKDSTDTLFQKIRYNLYNLHWRLFPNFDSNKNDNVGFMFNPDNDNYFRGEANNPNFATSGRYKAILVDEFSKWEETDEMAWTSMGDSSPCRIVVSTPWGIGRKFAKLRFSGEIEVLTFHWSEHPVKGAGKYQGQHPYLIDKGTVWLSEWYLHECERRKGNIEADIGQELDIDYLSSGTPYFNNKIVQGRYSTTPAVEGKRYEIERIENGINLFEDSNGRMFIAEETPSEHEYRYIISADVGEGLEKGDNSVCYVYDRVEKKDVAWFVGKIDTTLFAYLLQHLAFLYENAYIIVESNNHGHAVLQKLKEIHDNLYHQQDFSKAIDLDTVRLGWNTNVATRPIMCGELREAINSDSEGVFDKQFYQECLTFVFNRHGKPEADVGCLDDRVMAQAMKWQLHKWLPAPIVNQEQLEKKYDAPRFGGVEVDNKRDIRSIWK